MKYFYVFKESSRHNYYLSHAYQHFSVFFLFKPPKLLSLYLIFALV